MKKVVDFFAGSGLVSLGLKEWFETIWANDVDPLKAQIFNQNIKECPLALGDISHIKSSMVPAADLYWASFPCQDLSLAGNYAGLKGERSSLVNQFLRIIEGKRKVERPPVIALENVYGLLTSNGGDDYAYIHRRLGELGYRSGGLVLNAADWTPQSRVRVFIIAVDKGLASHGCETVAPGFGHPAALIDLSKKLKDFVYWNLPLPVVSSKTLMQLIERSVAYDQERSDRLLDLIPVAHRAKMQARLNVDSQAVMAGYKRTRQGQQVLELRFDGVAGCLRTAGGGSSKQIVVYRGASGLVARYMTAREAARLMGASDSFWLPSNQNQGYTAMGDGVALPVTKFLAEKLLYPLASLVRNSHAHAL